MKITWFSEGQGNTLTQSALIEDGRPTYIDFDFQPGEASIEGTVTSSGKDTSLTPGNTVYIFVSSQPGVEAMAYGSLDSHGQYRFVNLPTGPASVEVRYSRFGQGRQFYTEDIVLEDGGEHTLDITVR